MIFIIVKCKNCDKEFKCFPSRFNNRKNLFCSRKCNSEYIKNQNLNTVCEVCGKKYHVKPSVKQKQKHFCCSYKCMGILRKTIYKGEKNPNFDNHVLAKEDHDIMYKNGYIWEKCIGHPFAVDDTWVRQHRLIAEKYLLTEENSVIINGKRYLSPDYCVHHIDLNKRNNKIENLVVMTSSEHMKLHHKLRKENK